MAGAGAAGVKVGEVDPLGIQSGARQRAHQARIVRIKLGQGLTAFERLVEPLELVEQLDLERGPARPGGDGVVVEQRQRLVIVFDHGQRPCEIEADHGRVRPFLAQRRERRGRLFEPLFAPSPMTPLRLSIVGGRGASPA